MCLLAALDSQGIVVKCTAAIFFRTVDCAAWLVCYSRKFDHITPIMIELHWLPTEQRIQFKILLITVKALNQLAPMYISNILSHYCPSRVL